ILRGYGISGFALPVDGPIVRGTEYGGVSLTLGLPGYSKPLVYSVYPEMKSEIAASVGRAFDKSVAEIMTRRLREGASVDAAQRSTLREGRQLRQVLQNLIDHGRSLAIRPLFVLDAARLAGVTNSANALCLGGGFRVASQNWTAEGLFVDTVTGTIPS